MAQNKIGFILSSIALIVLIIQQFESNKLGVIISLGIIFCCFVIEYFYKKNENKI
jgi:hypothetical protein